MRGIAWAMTIEGRVGVHMAAVVGSTLFRRAPGTGWIVDGFGTHLEVDTLAQTLTARIEAVGGKLAKGPVEFDAPVPAGAPGDMTAWAEAVGIAARNAMYGYSQIHASGS